MRQFSWTRKKSKKKNTPITLLLPELDAPEEEGDDESSEEPSAISFVGTHTPSVSFDEEPEEATTQSVYGSMIQSAIKGDNTPTYIGDPLSGDGAIVGSVYKEHVVESIVVGGGFVRTDTKEVEPPPVDSEVLSGITVPLITKPTDVLPVYGPADGTGSPTVVKPPREPVYVPDLDETNIHIQTATKHEPVYEVLSEIFDGILAKTAEPETRHPVEIAPLPHINVELPSSGIEDEEETPADVAFSGIGIGTASCDPEEDVYGNPVYGPGVGTVFCKSVEPLHIPELTAGGVVTPSSKIEAAVHITPSDQFSGSQTPLVACVELPGSVRGRIGGVGIFTTDNADGGSSVISPLTPTGVYVRSSGIERIKEELLSETFSGISIPTVSPAQVLEMIESTVRFGGNLFTTLSQSDRPIDLSPLVPGLVYIPSIGGRKSMLIQTPPGFVVFDGAVISTENAIQDAIPSDMAEDMESVGGVGILTALCEVGEPVDLGQFIPGLVFVPSTDVPEEPPVSIVSEGAFAPTDTKVVTEIPEEVSHIGAEAITRFCEMMPPMGFDFEPESFVGPTVITEGEIVVITPPPGETYGPEVPTDPDDPTPEDPDEIYGTEVPTDPDTPTYDDVYDDTYDSTYDTEEEDTYNTFQWVEPSGDGEVTYDVQWTDAEMMKLIFQWRFV